MFDDTFVEELVARRSTTLSILVRVGIILLAIALSIVGSLYITIIFPLVFAAICVGAYFMFRFQSVEYEYSFTNGDLDVDKILGKRRRKRMLEVSSQKILVMAPYTAEFESEAAAHQVSEKYDFSSSNRAERWFFIFEGKDGQKGFVVFEPSERMRTAMKKYLRVRLKESSNKA